MGVERWPPVLKWAWSTALKVESSDLRTFVISYRKVSCKRIAPFLVLSKASGSLASTGQLGYLCWGEWPIRRGRSSSISAAVPRTCRLASMRSGCLPWSFISIDLTRATAQVDVRCLFVRLDMCLSASECLYVCLCPYVYLCLYVFGSESVCLYVRVSLCVLCVSVCMLLCLCVSLCLFKSICACVPVYVCPFVCLHASIHLSGTLEV